jgi:uncharacterized protein YxeA
MKIIYKFINLVTAIFLICIVAIVFSTKVTQGNSPLLQITNKTAITFESVSESLADLEYRVFDPKGKESFYKLKTNSGNGFDKQELPLGNKKDEGIEGCVKFEEETKRRIGICEDGKYRASLQATDAAGNRSIINDHIIERDTVKPAAPDVGEVYQCGSNLCIEVSGEQGAALYVNDKYNSNVKENINIFTLFTNWKYDTTYDFSLKIVDIFGVALPKYHKLDAHINIAYLTLLEALNYCNIFESQLLFSDSALSCTEKAMGIDDYWEWHRSIQAECRYAIPLYTQICMYNIKN